MVVVAHQGALDLGLVPESDVQLVADVFLDHLHGVFIVVHYKYIHNIDKDGRPNNLHIYSPIRLISVRLTSVTNPASWSAKATFSVQTLPTGFMEYGHPPSPPTEESTVRQPE